MSFIFYNVMEKVRGYLLQKPHSKSSVDPYAIENVRHIEIVFFL